MTPEDGAALDAVGVGPPDSLAGRRWSSMTMNQSGAYFRLRVVDIFEEARRRAAARLEIIWSRRSHFQFMFGDVPAISAGVGGHALGIPGVATTVFLPLSPTRLAALSAADRFEAVGAGAVRRVNALRVAKAHNYLFMHPRSGLDAFVASERAPTGLVLP